MNAYPLLVIGFFLWMVVFGVYLYSKREGAASLIGSVLSLVGLILVVITIVAWLLPGFFFNIS